MAKQEGETFRRFGNYLSAATLVLSVCSLAGPTADAAFAPPSRSTPIARESLRRSKIGSHVIDINGEWNADGGGTSRRRMSMSLLSALTASDGEPTSSVNDNGKRSHNSSSGRGRDVTDLGTLTIPSMGIGTISWSSDSFTSVENEELQSLVSEAIAAADDVGGAFFDTAERYGGNLKAAFGLGWGETEQLLRTFLSSSSRPVEGSVSNNSVIATKFTPSPWRTTKESVVEACLQSRKRLGVDQIDLYQLHMPDIVQPFKFLGGQFDTSKDEIYWDGLAECYHRGLVKNVGVSNYGPTLVTRCHEALARRGVPLASNQIAYSLIGRKDGAQETVDRCEQLGVKVLAYYPFAMGLLTGKYSSKDGGSDGMHAEEGNPAFAHAAKPSLSLTNSGKSKLELIDLKKYATGDGKLIPHGGISPVLRVLETVARNRNKSVAQVALNYCICKGVVPIPGARTVHQLRDNLGALGWRLSDEEVASLEYEADRLGFGFEGAGFKRTSEKFVGYGVEKWALD